MASYWFKRRRYGWGWAPASWQGWAVLVAFVVLVVGGALTVQEDEDTTGFVVYTLVLVAALVAVCALKGPRPRWRWGRSDADDPAQDY